MAAAYNVPLGGALFAIEVLLGTTSVTAVLAALTTSFLAVAVSWIMPPNTPAFSVAPLSLSPSILLFGALAGPLLGIASAFYVRVIGWAERGKPNGYMTVLAPICVFVFLGFASIRFPEVLGNGKNVV
jgi:CIC family chloride channel protein